MRRSVFSSGRTKIGLSDGKCRWAVARDGGPFHPKGRKQAFRMELFSFCACGGGRLLCEERRRAPAARYMTGLVYTIACHSLFPGAYAPIASLASAVLYEFFGQTSHYGQAYILLTKSNDDCTLQVSNDTSEAAVWLKNR